MKFSLPHNSTKCTVPRLPWPHALPTISLVPLHILTVEWVLSFQVPLLIKVKAFFGGNEFEGAKSAIDTAAQKYVESMGFLTATMTAELLHHDKNERREKMLIWLWTGDYWNRHQLLRSQRVAGMGEWFLQCESFQQWKSGTGSHLLISLGIRMSECYVSH